MSKANYLNPDGHDFDPFLFSNVGEDKNGTEITVISALSRLGVEPWQEAAELAALDPKAAGNRLCLTLERLKDMPALDGQYSNLAAELVARLPKRQSPGVARKATTVALKRPPISIGWLVILAIIIFGLVRIYILAHSG